MPSRTAITRWEDERKDISRRINRQRRLLPFVITLLLISGAMVTFRLLGLIESSAVWTLPLNIITATINLATTIAASVEIGRLNGRLRGMSEALLQERHVAAQLELEEADPEFANTLTPIDEQE